MLSRIPLSRVARAVIGIAILGVAANSCSSGDDGIGISETCTVSSVTVTPATGAAAVGATTTLVASVAASNCSPLPQIAWESDATHIATVSPAGIVTGVSPGTATITASAGGKSGTSAVTVRVAVASVVLSAPGTTVVIGSTIQVNAQAKDANGNVLTQQQFAWTTSNNTIAGVTQAGVITGVAPGSATITASADGKSATLNITVTGAATLSITNITPATNAVDRSIESNVQIQFSGTINATTVNAQSVAVTTAGAAVPGTLTVNGSTVTFTPTALLTEFNTTYTVTVSTAVQSVGANSLPSGVTSTFTTAFWDPSYYYRVTNQFMGANKALDTGVQDCFFGDLGSFSGQNWYFGPAATPGYSFMRNQFQGATKALEGADEPIACFMLAPPAGTYFTGQMWKAVPYPGVAGGYRLQNQNHGSAKSLDAKIVNGVNTPSMALTGNFSGQIWYFTRLAHR